MSSNLVFSPDRVARYSLADQLCPNARRRERLPILEALKTRLWPGARVLEIGCGAGTLTRALLEQGYIVETVDPYFPAPPGVSRHSDFNCVNGIPLSIDAKFDAIVSLATMHHLATDKDFLTDPLHADIFRIIKPGGVLVIMDVPNPDAALQRSGEVAAERAAGVAQFFRDVVDVYSVPQHVAVYLDLQRLGARMAASDGWTILAGEFRECDWHFCDRATALTYVERLFNLNIIDGGMVFREASTALLLDEAQGEISWSWALDFLVMQRA